jgi:hypothetical protein
MARRDESLRQFPYNLTARHSCPLRFQELAQNGRGRSIALLSLLNSSTNWRRGIHVLCALETMGVLLLNGSI